MYFQKLFCVFIRSPDRRQTSCFCCHNIDSISVIGTHRRYSRTYKFHYFIFYISIFENGRYNCDRNILRSDSWIWFSIQINCDHFRIFHIPCLFKNLFYQFSSAFSNRHRSKCAVSCMGIRSKDHLSTASHGLSHILMDNSHMRWQIDSAIFLCCCKSKYMIIFVDRSSYCTKAVMTTGKYIRKWEFFDSRGSGCLNNSNISQVMTGDRIKFNLQILFVFSNIMRLQNIIGNRSGFVLFFFILKFFSRFIFRNNCCSI